MNLRLMLLPTALLLSLVLSGCGQIPYTDEEIASARVRSGSAQVDDQLRAEPESNARVAKASSDSAGTAQEDEDPAASEDLSDTEGGAERFRPANTRDDADQAAQDESDDGAASDRQRTDRPSHASQPKRVKRPQPIPIEPTATERPLPTATRAPTEAPAPTADPMENTGPPTRVEIPAIGVDAIVELVGLTPDRAMDVPKGWMNVGWYENGFYPGELGNSVIAGHLDTSTGGPAVFWDLNQLVPGDEVTVTYENGSRLTFSVVDNRVYNHDAEGAIIESIFGKSLTPDLNLVTCDGAWDHGLATYAKRLVVFTTLLPEKSVFAGGDTELID